MISQSCQQLLIAFDTEQVVVAAESPLSLPQIHRVARSTLLQPLIPAAPKQTTN